MARVREGGRKGKGARVGAVREPFDGQVRLCGGRHDGRRR